MWKKIIGGDESRPMDEILSDEEKKKKLVYIVSNVGPGNILKLMEFNPHQGRGRGGGGFKDVTPPLADNPPDFTNLRCYSVAALDSKLYFIGGYYPAPEKGLDGVASCRLRDGVASNRVFVYDTKLKRWEDNFPPMNVKRAFCIVFTYNKTIYVFGCSAIYLPKEGLPREQLAEFYDPNVMEWKFLKAAYQAPSKLRKIYNHVITGVSEEDGTVLFYVEGVAAYGFNFDNHSWFKKRSIEWSGTVAVFKSNLLSHQHGNIYAYEFKPDSKPVSQPRIIFTLKDATKIFGIPALDSNIRPSFLVNVGNGKLCLLYALACEGELFRCHTLQFKHLPHQSDFTLYDTQNTKLVTAGTTNFNFRTAETRVATVLALDATGDLDVNAADGKSSKNGACARGFGKISSWVGKLEQPDVLLSVGVIGAVVAVAYNIYRRSR